MVLANVDVTQWHAHPDTWLLFGAIVAAYAVALRRIGPNRVQPGHPTATRGQVASFALGVLAIWLASDWPIHDVAEGSMYSVHMVQHLVITMVAAPLLLLGTPAWLLREILRPPSLFFRFARRMCRFFPALAVFNVVLVFTHWPGVVRLAIESHPAHFFLHALLFFSALLVWMPVVSPLPEIPRLTPLVRMMYLFAQSVVPTVPASFLTFGSKPLYSVYVGLPHLWGMSSLEDQQLAGLIMKIGGGTL